jgi:hypothetical protein
MATALAAPSRRLCRASRRRLNDFADTDEIRRLNSFTETRVNALQVGNGVSLGCLLGRKACAADGNPQTP